MYSPYCLTQVKVFSYSAWQGCRRNFVRFVITAVRLFLCPAYLLSFCCLTLQVWLLCAKPPILRAQFVPLIFARRTWCFFWFFFFEREKMALLLKCISCKKKKKEESRAGGGKWRARDTCVLWGGRKV